LSTLLASLDTDTREFLTSILASLDRGTRGRANDLRDILVALGPTTRQVRTISAALAHRRNELARLVHNLAIVTRDASQDRQLATVVVSGNRTLKAVASESDELKSTLYELPSTLRLTSKTLGHAATFADDLGPASSALIPGVRGLPATLKTAGPFAKNATHLVQTKLRPFSVKAQPMLLSLGPAVHDLSALTPGMTRSFQTLNYFLNELAYNPKGDDEGFLFWFAWMAQNWNSAFSYGDAHGAFGRASAFVTCNELTSLSGELNAITKIALGVSTICPAK
jgi:ABC-type transporter Mla subunit MlaD